MEAGAFLRVILAALCLPPRAPGRRWRGVEATIRRAAAGHLGQALPVLRRSGFWEEALWLETPGVLGEAEGRLCRDEVLTAACPSYPPRWHRDGLGPGALWRRGPMPAGPFVAIVGSRSPSPSQAIAARTLAIAAVEAGHAVASGGATGIDALAARGVASVRGRLVEVLPEGIALRSSRGCLLSMSSDAAFTSSAALHRNALLYGMAGLTVAIGPRRGEGGTWQGAVSALRRRLGPVAVWEDDAPGVSALLALGAMPLPAVERLPELLAAAEVGSRGGLFEGLTGARWVS